MGIISDTFEDNRERIGQWVQSLSSLCRSEPLAPTSVPVLERCPLCNKEFPRGSALREHALASHRRLHHFLTVNGVVVPAMVLVEDRIESAVLHFWGHEQAHARLEVWSGAAPPQGFDLRVHDGEPLDLSAHVGACTRLDLSLAYGDLVIRNEVFVKELPAIDFEHIHRMYAEFQAHIAHGHRPSDAEWSAFRARLEQPATHAVASRYVDGLWEYLWALVHDRTASGAGRQGPSEFLERSFGTLRPFRTELAQLAVRSLALRFNWFWMLADLPASSRFEPLGRFFNSTFSMVAADIERAPARTSPPSATTDLLIDDFDEHCLDAVDAFYAARFKEVAEELQAMRRTPAFSGSPLASVKWSVLAARLARIQERRDNAVKYYEALLGNRDFEQEAGEIVWTRR